MKRILLFLSFVGLLSCNSMNIKKAMDSVSTAELATDISIISADSMMGRAPFSIGENRTTSYLQKRMVELGLEPAFDGSYFQEVPMVSIISRIPQNIDFQTNNGSTIRFNVDNDICAWCPTIQPKVKIKKAELVFAGFGINAPEFGWNDFEGVDLSNKVIVVIVNDPGFFTKDTSMFRGNAMTYYGRWVYKFEEAERQGALGCLIIHEEAAAGYPWEVAANKNNSPVFHLNTPKLKNPKCKLNGWLSKSAASDLLNACGLNYDELKQKALSGTFKPVAMNACISIDINTETIEQTTKNVAGMIRGTKKPDEFLVYSAHWDHLGVGVPINGDSIRNGASDNAAAIAWMFAIAKAFKEEGIVPQRSILFFSPTAEESGMYGSTYFVENAPIDISKTVACINNDVILFLGKFKDVTVTGLGHSSLDEILAEEAHKFGRYVVADPNPENGMFFRSDQLPFLKAGVPSIFAKGYSHQIEMGEEKTQEFINHYWKHIYHKPADEYIPERDNLEGLAEDAKLFYLVGRKLANGNIYPKWNRRSEFFVER